VIENGGQVYTGVELIPDFISFKTLMEKNIDCRGGVYINYSGATIFATSGTNSK